MGNTARTFAHSRDILVAARRLLSFLDWLLASWVGRCIRRLAWIHGMIRGCNYQYTWAIQFIEIFLPANHLCLRMARCGSVMWPTFFQSRCFSLQEVRRLVLCCRTGFIRLKTGSQDRVQ